ncbi:MAG: hypothetical protein Q8J69_03560 [Sphingobacteriaceae bacterium]|nr:hypothetical protein [Sphingobacteriaceae bacterium]
MRKTSLIILLLLVGSASSLFASSIRGKMRLPAGSTMLLYDFRMHVSDTVATATTGSDSIFLFRMPAPAYHGFYRLTWEGGYVDVLYDGEAISFEQKSNDTYNILRGSSWLHYRSYKEELRKIRENQGRLQALLNEYEGEARLLQQIKKQQKRLRKAEAAQLRKINKVQNLGTRQLRFELPFLGQSGAALDSFYTRERYLELLDLSDTLQLHYNLIPQFLVAYYRLFAPEEGEDAEVLGISYLNRVFDKLEENPIYFAPVADFLRIGFEQMGLPKALHLIQQRVATQNACTDPQLSERLRNTLLAYNRIAAGATAPTLEQLVQADGKMLEKRLPSSDLLVFWSADCPHCLRDLPTLHLWLKNNRPQIAVTAIALDSWEVGWKAEKQNLEHWEHLRDPKGWNGPSSIAYRVHATPFFVRIDKNGKIIDTYRSVADLRKALD